MSGWRDRIEVSVELGLRGSAVGGAEWDVTDWDEASWSGLEPTWVALDTAEVRGVDIRRGRRAGARERIPPGTASVLLWWEAPGDRWLFKPTTPVRLGMELRVMARVDGGLAFPIYRGAVRQLKDDWDPVGPYQVTAHLVDRKADLAAVDLPEAALTGLGDTTDARLERILGLAGISLIYAVAWDASLVEHASSNFARNLLDEAEVTVEGENGLFWVDESGYFRFRARGWYLDADPPLVTWTNLLGDPTAVFPSRPFSTGQSLDYLVNQVSMARVGGTAYTVTDASSSITYGLRTYRRMDLTLRHDADLEETADELLEQLRTRTETWDALTAEVRPDMAEEVLLGLVGQEIGDTQAVAWDDGTGDLYDELLHVQGLTHRITPESWVVTTNLWRYAPPPPTWGTAVWGTSEWG